MAVYLINTPSSMDPTQALFSPSAGHSVRGQTGRSHTHAMVSVTSGVGGRPFPALWRATTATSLNQQGETALPGAMQLGRVSRESACSGAWRAEGSPNREVDMPDSVRVWVFISGAEYVVQGGRKGSWRSTGYVCVF